MLSPVSVALIANPASRTVSGLVPIREEPITSDAFFDFLGLFLDKNGLRLNAGYAGEGEQLKQLKASMSAWELYNAVTDYASNNTAWDASDNRRGMLQGEAFRFLMRERDIKNYSDIFA